MNYTIYHKLSISGTHDSIARCSNAYSTHQVVIESLEAAGEEDKVLKVCAALVLIGYSPKLGFLPSEVIG